MRTLQQPDDRTPTGDADGLAAIEAAVETGLAALETALETELARLADAARALPDPDIPATGSWSARMVIAHVVFWHESFARNLADVAAGRRPTPLRGTYAVLSERARAELGDLDVGELLDRAAAAQAVIRKHIGEPGIGLIPYRQGSRPYTPAEHLHVTAGHVAQHAAELERAGPKPAGV